MTERDTRHDGWHVRVLPITKFQSAIEPQDSSSLHLPDACGACHRWAMDECAARTVAKATLHTLRSIGPGLLAAFTVPHVVAVYDVSGRLAWFELIDAREGA